MQYSEMKTVLKGRLARFSASTSLDQYLNAELNAMMGEIEEEGFAPWFLFARDNTITLSADSYTASLPSDFMRERLMDSEEPIESFCKIFDSGHGRWKNLKLLGENPLQQGVVTDTALRQGEPTAYYVDRITEEITFDKWADQDYTISLEYIKVGDRFTATPADDEEPLWAKHAPGYIIAMTGMRIALMYVKNIEAGQVFLADTKRERTKLIHKHTTILESKMNPNSEN